MKRGYNSKRIYRVRLASGEMGWRQRLQSVYRNFENWKNCAETWQLHRRLNNQTINGLWQTNPVIQGGTNFSDFQLAPL